MNSLEFRSPLKSVSNVFQNTSGIIMKASAYSDLDSAYMASSSFEITSSESISESSNGEGGGGDGGDGGGLGGGLGGGGGGGGGGGDGVRKHELAGPVTASVHVHLA